MMVLPPEPPSKLHDWLSPDDVLDYGVPIILLILAAKGGMSLIDTVLPAGRRRRGTTMIQESGPGGVEVEE